MLSIKLLRKIVYNCQVVAAENEYKSLERNVNFELIDSFAVDIFVHDFYLIEITYQFILQ